MRSKNSRRKRGGRRWISARTWFAIHAWSGFKLGILLFIVFASGTLATISHELDWLAQPEMRVEAPAGDYAGDYDFSAMLDALASAFPAARVELVERPETAGFAAVARIRDPRLGVRRVMLDPYSGEVLGHAHWYGSFQRFLRDFHRYLLLPNFLGIFIVGATSFLAMASLISSFWIYPNWWRGFFRFRPGRAGADALWKEIHKLFGVWSMVFVLIMGVTGIWYVLEFTLALAGADDALQFQRPRLEAARVADLEPGLRQLDPDRILAIARDALPGIRIGMVIPPGTPDAPYYITGQTGEILVRDRASHVFIDPYDGTVLARQHASELGALRRWVDTADPLHFGDFAGLWSKIPYLLFGTAMSLLAATGVWLRWKRIRTMLRRDAIKAERARRARMGLWKWATAVAMVASAVFGTWQIGRYNAPGTDWHSLGEAPLRADGRPLPARWLQGDGQVIAALPAGIHFDPERHRVAVPECGLAPTSAGPGIHHRIVSIRPPDPGFADCLRQLGSSHAIAAGRP